ncbi:lipid II:glycine glycyltransferase FemX [Schaalia suimastitidis]|uniref:lipid II:glycine glycyltransferase FemX n=1 Tax=Schaalia suimastitidis TaxID=121163 RepID=UPI0003F82189|nr:GNAT family N-acetyltransferase [Schaalia suimastitidis]
MDGISTRLVALDAEAMRIAAAGVVPVPLEQSAPWEKVEENNGRRCWARLAWYEGDKCCAIIALYEYQLRWWRFLWARWGPVWLKEATPEREAAFRRDLRQYIQRTDKGIVFVRLHAWFNAADVITPITTITYDRTVIIHTFGGSETKLYDSMPSSGRRNIRRAQKKAADVGATMVDDTGISLDNYRAYHAIMEETAQRDGFRPHPMDYYLTLMNTLGPQHAHLFSLKDADGNILCWDMVLTHDRRAIVPYGASTARARQLGLPALLDYMVVAALGAQGVKSVDLMGIHSPRVPELFTVGKYKMSFVQQATDVAGGWDMPVKCCTFTFMRQLRRFKCLTKRLRGH